MDLFKLVVLILGGMTIVTDLYSYLQGEGGRERERERERGPVRRKKIMLVTIWEQLYVSQ